MARDDVPRHLQWGAKISAEEAARRQLSAITRIDDLAAKAGETGIRLLVLINGGAAAAALAFVGALITKQPDIPLLKLILVADTLRWFAMGVGLAGASFACGYLAAYFIVLSLNSMTCLNHDPWITESKRSGPYYWCSIAFHVIGTMLALAALGLFIYGVFALRDAVAGLTT